MASPRAGAPAPSDSSGTSPATGPAAIAATTQVRVGELISAVSALALLIVLFATTWYGVAGVPDPSAARPAISTAETGWDGLTVTRWVLLVTVLVALGSVVLHAAQRRQGARTDTSRLIAWLGALSTVLLIYRVLIALPASDRVIDQKLGALLGLACALGIALGGHESIVEQRRARTAVRRPGGLARRADREE